MQEDKGGHLEAQLEAITADDTANYLFLIKTNKPAIIIINVNNTVDFEGPTQAMEANKALTKKAIK